MSVRVFAPAKINLTLQVGRARANGMHSLQSVVTFADVGDWIEAGESDGLSLSIRGLFKDQLSEGDPENLVLRAARALAQAAGVAPHAALTLEKNLPVASGIGGGSADAAATLRALTQLWSLDLSGQQLKTIAASLGADVPICVSSKPAYMAGVGETSSGIAMPAFDAVLVNPRYELATALVYRQFDRMHGGATFSEAPAPAWRSRGEALTAITAIGNDLAAPATALLPELGFLAEILRNDARVAYAGMSGSGATMFALVDDAHAAEALAADLAAAHPHWWIAPTRLASA